jgi:hypothetical protein
LYRPYRQIKIVTVIAIRENNTTINVLREFSLKVEDLIFLITSNAIIRRKLAAFIASAQGQAKVSSQIKGYIF